MATFNTLPVYRSGRLCQSDMAKMCTNFLKMVSKELMEHDSEEEAHLSTHVLAPHMNKLPMPEDCLLVELQELSSAYVAEVAGVWQELRPHSSCITTAACWTHWHRQREFLLGWSTTCLLPTFFLKVFETATYERKDLPKAVVISGTVYCYTDRRTHVDNDNMKTVVSAKGSWVSLWHHFLSIIRTRYVRLGNVHSGGGYMSALFPFHCVSLCSFKVFPLYIFISAKAHINLVFNKPQTEIRTVILWVERRFFCSFLS